MSSFKYIIRHPIRACYAIYMAMRMVANYENLSIYTYEKEIGGYRESVYIFSAQEQMLDVIGEIMENRLEFDVYEDEDLILSNRNHNY
jgi:hypothetical protein